MKNHYSAIIESLDGNLSKGMRQLNCVYTEAQNAGMDVADIFFKDDTRPS